MKKVSVIIPTFNRKQYIAQTIDSVLQQDFNDYEIIVVDDGSVDGTRTVIEEYAKRHNDRFRFLFQNNRGPAAARNAGIAQAEGEYIAFLDSDDLWLSNKLSQQLKLFNERSEIDLVYGSYDLIDESGIISNDVLRKYYATFPEGNVLHKLLLRCFIWTSTVVIKKQVFDHIGGFDESLHIGEDYDFFIRAAKTCKIACVYNVVARYRQHEGNIMKADMLNRIPSEVVVVQNFANRNPGVLKLISRKLWRKRLSQPYFDIAYNCLQQGDCSLSRYFLIGAIKQFPFRFVYYRYFLMSLFPKRLILCLKSKKDDRKLGESYG